MPTDSKELYKDSRVLNTAAVIPNGEINSKIQLLTSYYLRHTETYQAFSEATKGKPEVNCLVVGLGNLSELIGYTAAYYGQHNNVDGLQVKAVDLIEKSFFEDLSTNKENFCLGKDDQNSPIKPVPGQESAFNFDSEKSEYILRPELVKFIQETIKNGSFGIGVENIDQLGLEKKRYNFISCQNVLTYVTKTILPEDLNLMTSTIKNLIGLMSDDGILAIKTNGRKKAIAAIMESENFPVEFLNSQKEANGLYRKTDKPGQIDGYKETLARHQAQIARYKAEKENKAIIQ